MNTHNNRLIQVVHTILVVVNIPCDGEQLVAALQRVLQVVGDGLVVVQHLLLRALHLVDGLVERVHLRRHVALLEYGDRVAINGRDCDLVCDLRNVELIKKCTYF